VLTLEKGVLLDFIQQTVAETAVLEETKAKKTILLTLVRTQTKLHQQAAREMQAAAEKLSLSIVAIKNKNQFFEQGFLLNKGSIPPPIDGTLITLFQQEKKNRLGIERKSNGIELKASNGTKVIAVESGTVIFSGYLRGYGNTVIIHHGFQYFTVTSRIEKIMAHRGQEVKTGDTIGIVGDTAMLFDEGLYFEIRHGKQSLDPLLWLNPNRLSTLHELPTENPNE
jgi:septal ring factor EnvC (AmiA/AmiB activator)